MSPGDTGQNAHCFLCNGRVKCSRPYAPPPPPSPPSPPYQTQDDDEELDPLGPESDEEQDDHGLPANVPLPSSQRRFAGLHADKHGASAGALFHDSLSSPPLYYGEGGEGPLPPLTLVSDTATLIGTTPRELDAKAFWNELTLPGASSKNSSGATAERPSKAGDDLAATSTSSPISSPAPASPGSPAVRAPEAAEARSVASREALLRPTPARLSSPASYPASVPPSAASGGDAGEHEVVK